MATHEPPDDGVKLALGKALEHHNRRDRRPVTAKQAKAPKKRKRRNGVTAIDQARIDGAVTQEAQRHGDYRVVPFKLQEVVEGGKVKAKTISVVRNLARTQVERWQARGKLDERQMAAVMFYQEAWRVHIGEPRVTANYSPAIRRNASGAVELWASSQFRAKEALRLLDNEVFFREDASDFQVWQNVVIWDEPAGVAGGRIGFCHKPAEAIALFIIQRTANKIADVVIDSSRKDFAELLLNLDQPRKVRK